MGLIKLVCASEWQSLGVSELDLKGRDKASELKKDIIIKTLLAAFEKA